MFLSLNGEYSSILELMHYFYFEFITYIVLLIILAINCLRVVSDFKKLNNSDVNPSTRFSDIVVSILCEVAFAGVMMFQGVVADISVQASELWFNKIFIIFVVSLVILIVQLYFTWRISRHKGS